MKVTVSLSQQQRAVLVALPAGQSDPTPALERLIARAFREYCQEHPEECGDRPGAD